MSSRKPGAAQCIHTRPERGVAEISSSGDLDEACPCCLLGVDGNRVFQVAAQHVDLLCRFGYLCTDLVDMRRKEMDHALRPHWQLTQRLRGSDRKRFIEMDRKFHGCVLHCSFSSCPQKSRAEKSGALIAG